MSHYVVPKKTIGSAQNQSIIIIILNEVSKKDQPLDVIKWEIILAIRFMCMQVWKSKF
jgi:hypothetical protein